MFGGNTAGGRAPQKTPTSSLNTWYTVPTDTTAYWYVPYGATSVRIVMIGAGGDMTGANTSVGGSGGGCCEILLTVGASNGINENEELKFLAYSYSSQYSNLESKVWRTARDAINALGFVKAGAINSAGTAGTSVTTGNGLTVNAFSGGVGGQPYIVSPSYAYPGGGGGGAGPSGAGSNGTDGVSGGYGGAGGAGNSSLPGSSGGAGGNGAGYTPWGTTTNGSPGNGYGGGGGGQGWSGTGYGGPAFFRIYAS